MRSRPDVEKYLFLNHLNVARKVMHLISVVDRGFHKENYKIHSNRRYEAKLIY